MPFTGAIVRLDRTATAPFVIPCRYRELLGLGIASEGLIVAEHPMTVVAIRLVRACTTSAERDASFLGYQATMPVHEANSAAHVKWPQVTGSNCRYLVWLFLGKTTVRLVLQCARRTQSYGSGDCIGPGRLDLDPWSPGHIKYLWERFEAFRDVRASRRVPENGQFFPFVGSGRPCGARHTSFLGMLRRRIHSY
jgi:hypothetical protein